MKKTSIFFLIISVALIITGNVLRNNALKAAEEKDIKLFQQTINDNNDLVERIDFPADDTNKINLSLKDTDINIIGGAEECYAEIVNLNSIEYSAYVNNRSFNIDSDIISAMVGRAEGGKISFNGVRDYLRFDKHNTEKTVNIYITNDSTVKIFNIKLENGNINIDNMADKVCDFTVTLDNGNVSVSDTIKISLLDIEIKNGNVDIDNSYILNTDISIENGNVDFKTQSNIIYDYSIKNEAGKITVNSEEYKGKYETTNETPNGQFVSYVGVGNTTVTLVEAPIEDLDNIKSE